MSGVLVRPSSLFNQTQPEMPAVPTDKEFMNELIQRLYPICRSITGDGVRQTLTILGEHLPLERREVPSGTEVFDWEVPLEWNIRDAYVKDPSGRRVIDFKESNLSVVGYSVPFEGSMSLEELRKRIHTLPDRPDWIPYRTSYYKQDWGFCTTQRILDSLQDGVYEVRVDSSLEPGHLTYGELEIPGENDEEILISCHVCHPSLANDNLSSISVATRLAMELSARKNRYRYRFLFIPVTIGSVTWLALNKDRAQRVGLGLVLTCLGDSGAMHYKRSRRGDTATDRIMSYVLQRGSGDSVFDFSPYGYDERQFCSPGFDMPMGCLSRSTYGSFPEYHTSADNPDFLSPDSLLDSLDVLRRFVLVAEGNRRYRNMKPYGEPRLGKYGLYGSVGGVRTGKFRELAYLWVLNGSDGGRDLLDIATRSGIPFEEILEAAVALESAGLLVACE